MELALIVGFILIFIAYRVERRWRRACQAENRSLRDRIYRQVEELEKQEKIKQSYQMALIQRGGLIADHWPEEFNNTFARNQAKGRAINEAGGEIVTIQSVGLKSIK